MVCSENQNFELEKLPFRSDTEIHPNFLLYTRFGFNTV
jgi:hypothetical protein